MSSPHTSLVYFLTQQCIISLEYTAPETLPSPETGLLQQVGSKADMWSLGMILHKLLFFKLPYRYVHNSFFPSTSESRDIHSRYAAEGDANGEPISRNEEGEKLERLEKEVLNYPGYVFPTYNKNRGYSLTLFYLIASNQHPTWCRVSK